MKRSQKINVYVYKLLIEQKMDGFSVVEARDAARFFPESPQDVNELRKIVYRQILNCLERGWLRCEGSGREKRYFTTDEFNLLSFVPRKSKSRVSKSRLKVSVSNQDSNDYSELTVECNRLKGELEVTLGEIDKYKTLKEQYPEQFHLLERLHVAANEKAALFMGNINAITNMLNSLSYERA
ncbi:hypothetical protein [Vibrio neptunius]|uniref:Transcriptional regulator VspR n=1 Tax=Vibrio neptunius TaxID=170651 RepID=A0ABS3A404_9VIBR|nr:hypothetical protein [Vibrio neptunius]MBN3493789.1 hypothetical protein [Vibrio neptunius]MBN3516285.1 hypothetical protein [Vibrio neptunius]MBN3550230.1 hypothetical protein [Vibrio neptunius]MBN3578506.1 hypothetical protein [Vibrio neptunius]MCH9872171.1 hypothetical protein [Vibrio neptunius]